MTCFECAVVDVGDKKIMQHATTVVLALCRRRGVAMSSFRLSPPVAGAVYPLTRTILVRTRSN
jgi:hypothetical protein